VDRPLDLFEVSRDLLLVLAHVDAGDSTEDVLKALGVPGSEQALVSSALDMLAADGLLVDVSGAPTPEAPPMRDVSQEVARRLSPYPDIQHLEPGFAERYRALAHATLTSIPLSYALHAAVRYLAGAGIPGAVVECGVWRGGSMALAAQTLLEAGDTDRDVWLYDTFDWRWENPGEHDGFTLMPDRTRSPLAHPERPDSFVEGSSAGDVLALLSATGYPVERFRLVPGLVQETVPEQCPEQIALLRLDTDLYDSTRHELEHLYPRLVAGGVLLVDDYGKLDGATRAVDEYFSTIDEPLLLHRIDTQGRIGVKLGVLAPRKAR
jgi:O-methyltransferase